MRIRRTPESNTVFSLQGGNEDNDAWVCRTIAEDANLGPQPCLSMVFEISDSERAAIVAGENLELIILGEGMPPISLRTTSIPIGAKS